MQHTSRDTQALGATRHGCQVVPALPDEFEGEVGPGRVYTGQLRMASAWAQFVTR